MTYDPSSERKHYTPEFKQAVINKLLGGNVDSGTIGRQFGIHPGVVRRWYREARERLPDGELIARLDAIKQVEPPPVDVVAFKDDIRETLQRHRDDALREALDTPVPREVSEQYSQDIQALQHQRRKTEAEARPPVPLIESVQQQRKVEVQKMATATGAGTLTREFKEAAVRKVKAAGGQVTAAIAKEVGVTAGAIRKWMSGESLDDTRRIFDRKFKTELVARVAAGESAAKVGAEYKIRGSVISAWVNDPQFKRTVFKRAVPKRGAKNKRGRGGSFVYDAEIKRQALEMVEQGVPIPVVTKKLKLGRDTVYGWRWKEKREPTPKSNGHADPKSNGASFDAKSITLYLKHAVAAMEADLHAGRLKKYDKAHLLTQLAYQELVGE